MCFEGFQSYLRRLRFGGATSAGGVCSPSLRLLREVRGVSDSCLAVLEKSLPVWLYFAQFSVSSGHLSPFICSEWLLYCLSAILRFSWVFEASRASPSFQILRSLQTSLPLS